MLEKNEQLNKQLEVEDLVKNIGPYHYSEISSHYAQADIVFVPSLLETFSATYLEAMVANKPLVVAQKDFAKEVCKNGFTMLIQ